MTVLSDKVRLLYPKLLHNKMIIVPNSVSIKKIKVSKSSNYKIILNVGRLESSKDHETLIKAFALIHNNYPEWKLRIIGDGKLKVYLTKLVDS